MPQATLRLASILLLGLGLSTAARADILVLSSGNNRLVRFTDSGAFVSSTDLGSGSQLSDIEVDSLGNHYISRNSGLITKYDSSLAVVGSFGSISSHYGLGIDAADRIHAAGSGLDQVQVTNASGSLLETYGRNPGNYRDVAFVGTERWVTSFGSPGVQVFDASGTYQRTIATGLGPFGISEAIGGGAWVLRQDSHDVHRIDASGSIVFSFNADSAPLPPTVGQVRYIEADAFGRVLVSAYASNRVDVFNSGGVFQFSLSQGLSRPTGVFAARPTFAAVPEPATLAAAVFGVVAGAWAVRRRRSS
ncbi:MAG: PEP-CTERM sorting domain-containing protein [Isosphaeraceae bacterium]|nr:PEP-CTERM sorting domain-containing protein [Isosphaeraceae bacterium]